MTTEQQAVVTGGAVGGGNGRGLGRTRCVHADLVRSVTLGEEFVLSGSYDLSIKVGIYFYVLASLLANADRRGWSTRYGIGRPAN